MTKNQLLLPYFKPLSYAYLAVESSFRSVERCDAGDDPLCLDELRSLLYGNVKKYSSFHNHNKIIIYMLYLPNHLSRLVIKLLLKMMIS